MSTRYAELIHWMGIQDRKYFIPSTADIDLTNICNQDCFYCSTSDFRNRHPVQQKFDMNVQLIDKLATWRNYNPNSIGTFSTVIFSGGGEPTLFKDYEKIIEHTIDSDILAALITNGSNLHKMVENMSADKINKLLYIGIDIDAGSKQLYESIRKSKPTVGLFDQVCDNIKELAQIANNVDLKVVLNQFNSSDSALTDIFALAATAKVRQVYVRPLYDPATHYVFPINEYYDKITKLAEEFTVDVKINLTRFLQRNYSKCHQMYLFPVFCADGNIYTCCENKGNPNFSIGSWVEGDFREVWLSQSHHNCYDTVDTNLCHMCRSNDHNINIQNGMGDARYLERLMF